MSINVQDQYQSTVIQIKGKFLGSVDGPEFKEKLDVDFRRYVILGACNPTIAHQSLQEEIDLGLLLPCNVIVYEQDGGSVVAAIDAKSMLSVTGNSALEESASIINKKLVSAIDAI